MLKFDNQGYIVPADVVEIDLLIFKEYFVFNDTRKELFESYLSFNEHLQNLFTDDYFQWVNGSFATQKIKPNDIDVVSFIPHTVFEKNGKAFEEIYRNKH
jgi:hypothetical protein